MIITLCIAAASIGGAIFAAHKRASSLPENRILTPITSTEATEESLVLIDILKAELTKLQYASKPNVNNMNNVINSFRILFESTWSPGTYYYPTHVSPFLNVLKTSAALQQANISSEYIRTLTTVIERLAPDCANAIARGENGKEITTFSYNCMDSIKADTLRLEKFVKLAAQTSMTSER